jgi:hypothetical protein
VALINRPIALIGPKRTIRYMDRSAISVVVSRWLPIAAARVRARLRSCGICGEQSGSGSTFSLGTQVSYDNYSRDFSTLIITHHMPNGGRFAKHNLTPQQEHGSVHCFWRECGSVWV